MKNMKLAALAALGLALPALAELQSANIVGYQTMPLESGTYTMFSVPFVHVNNDGKGMMLNGDLNFAGLTGGEDPAVSDQIWVWMPSQKGYARFFYYNGPDAEHGWRSTDGDQDLIESVKGFENGIPDGVAVYYKALSGSGKSVTGAGAIENLSEVQYDLVGGTYTMVGNPYPVATKLNDATSVSFKNITSAADPAVSDQIWLWIPADKGYRRFFNYNGSDAEHGWRSTDGDQDLIDVCKGYENGLPSGSAFYYKAQPGAGKEIIFHSPIK